MSSLMHPCKYSLTSDWADKIHYTCQIGNQCMGPHYTCNRFTPSDRLVELNNLCEKINDEFKNSSLFENEDARLLLENNINLWLLKFVSSRNETETK